MYFHLSVMDYALAFASFLLSSLLLAADGKVYTRCELARELRYVHEIPDDQLATWVCIAYRESAYNTSAVNRGSGDHGLFQISQMYWCSPPGEGFACGVSCAAFEDDDIEDDVVCARRIYRAHQRMSGNGFTAWVVYQRYCTDKAKVKKYLGGCFDDELRIGTREDTTHTTGTVQLSSTPKPEWKKIIVTTNKYEITKPNELKKNENFFNIDKNEYSYSFNSNGFKLIKTDTYK